LIRLLILSLIFITSLASARTVDRFTPETKKARMNLISRGLLGQLQTPEEKAQYRLLLCQPRAAWRETEGIADKKTRELYQGLILALVSTPDHDQNSASKNPASRGDDFRFPIDSSEIWRDEVEDMDLPSTCSFPTVAADKVASIREKAFQTLQPLMPETQNMTVLAIATDVGFVPALKEPDILGKQVPSLYLKRFQYFARQNMPSEYQIKISGMNAQVSNLDFSSIELTPHKLELPWLLR
jgi:hypothetical protein